MNYKHKKQIFFYCTMFYVLIGAGTGMGFNTIFVHQCKNLNGVKLTLNHISWISSIYPLMEMFGCFASAWLSEIWGRKSSLQLASLLNACGWLVIYFGNDIGTILTGRVINGFCEGFLLATCNCFLADVTVKQHMELVLSYVLFWHFCGIAVVNIVGTLTDWRITALVCVAIPLSNEIILAFIPESYIFLLNKKKYDVAKRSFLWSRRRTELSEFQEIRQRLEDSEKHEKLNLAKTLTKKEFLKPLFVVSIFSATIHVSGFVTLIYYALTILEKTISGLNEYVSMIILNVIKFSTLILGPVITKNVSIRKTAIVSGTISCSALFAFSLSTYLADMYPNNTFLKYVPLIPLSIYMIFMGGGLLPLKFAVTGIMFPPNVKALGNGLGCGANFFIFFVIIKTNPVLLDSLGHSITFCIYGGLMLSGLIIVYFVLPETKGKTCFEIEQHFSGKAPENMEEDTMIHSGGN